MQVLRHWTWNLYYKYFEKLIWFNLKISKGEVFNHFPMWFVFIIFYPKGGWASFLLNTLRKLLKLTPMTSSYISFLSKYTSEKSTADNLSVKTAFCINIISWIVWMHCTQKCTPWHYFPKSRTFHSVPWVGSQGTKRENVGIEELGLQSLPLHVLLPVPLNSGCWAFLSWGCALSPFY